MKRFIFVVSMLTMMVNMTKGQYLEEYTGSYLNEAEHAKWTKGKYAKYIDSARQGDAVSQVCIAEIYMGDDEGVLGNVDERWKMAAFWFRKAAEQGNVIGQSWMGMFYQGGVGGLPVNYKDAAYWYRKAAEQGDINGQAYLGEFYEKGKGVAKDYDEALKWYRLAAGNGSKDSQKKVVELEQKIKQRDAVMQEEKSKQEFERQRQSVNATQQQNQQSPKSTQPKSLVDSNIPINSATNKEMFAVVIGNERYVDESSVDFAGSDALIFKEYCRKTLGIGDNHIRYVANAGYNDIRRALNWLKQGLEAYGGDGNAIFYYAGHGVPDETQKTAYLLPVDGVGSDVESGYPLDKLYQALGDMPAKSVTVFLDACFSGAKRDGSMMASARGVAIKTKVQEPKGKMIVFSAAQGDETAYPYKSQQHGMFTYFLLRKLQETKGNVTLGELADYITREVKRQSFDENNRSQTPTVNASAILGDSWRSMKLRQ